MTFDEMSPLQRRLHNAALVIEAEGDDHGFAKLQKDAIDALQPNTQEPVAYVSRIAENGRADISWLQGVSVGDKLFTRPAPQQKPLTDEQIFGICENSNVPYKQPYFEVNRFTDVEELLYRDSSIFSPLKFARAIEAAHGVRQ